MNSIQDEEYEYDRFLAKLAYKAQEIQHDFNQLSDRNKIRFENDIMRTFLIKGVAGVSEYFNRRK